MRRAAGPAGQRAPEGLGGRADRREGDGRDAPRRRAGLGRTVTPGAVFSSLSAVTSGPGRSGEAEGGERDRWWQANRCGRSVADAEAEAEGGLQGGAVQSNSGSQALATDAELCPNHASQTGPATRWP